MKSEVVTLFPDMSRDVRRSGVLGRAQDTGRLQLGAWNPRDYTTDRHRTVDDRPYGGGPGMVMKVEPLRAALAAARQAAPGAQVVALSPQGAPFDQARARELAQRKALILVAGRYEGLDERVLEAEADAELSLGDYVLSGGELAALVVIDAVARLLPGVLGDADSAQQDSFMDGLLDYPHYTRPEELDGRRVPEVLLTGNHAEIRRWRHKQALGRTWLRRPDLLAARGMSAAEQRLLEEFLKERNDEQQDF